MPYQKLSIGCGAFYLRVRFFYLRGSFIFLRGSEYYLLLTHVRVHYSTFVFFSFTSFTPLPTFTP